MRTHEQALSNNQQILTRPVPTTSVRRIPDAAQSLDDDESNHVLDGFNSTSAAGVYAKESFPTVLIGPSHSMYVQDERTREPLPAMEILDLQDEATLAKSHEGVGSISRASQ